MTIAEGILTETDLGKIKDAMITQQTDNSMYRMMRVNQICKALLTISNPLKNLGDMQTITDIKSKIMKRLVVNMIIIAISSCGLKHEPNTMGLVEVNVPDFAPKSFAFLDDRSGSRASFEIPELLPQDLMPAIDYVANRGGAVMLGLITADSDKLTVQFRVDPERFPTAPQEPNADDFTNDSDRIGAEKKYKKLMMKYAELISEQQEKIALDQQTFVTEIKKLMATKRVDNQTDINNGINRGLIFHQTAPKNSELYTVIIGDGQGNSQNKLKDHGPLKIHYYLAYGSSNPSGNWVSVCSPIQTPDLKTTFDLLNL